MKRNNGGYKAMIRDRIPSTVDFALKWCRAKTKYVDLVYNQYIKFLNDKEQRKYQTRAVLGLVKGNRQFDFDWTIDNAVLSKEELEYWTFVKKYVTWFSQIMLPVVDCYKTLKADNDSDDNFVFLALCKTQYLQQLPSPWREKLCKQLVQHIKKYYV